MYSPAREWDASSYHRLSDRQFGWGLKVLERLALRGDESVLDAGCGTGRVTAKLAALLPRGHLVAVDLSENMVRAACQTLFPDCPPGESRLSRSAGSDARKRNPERVEGAQQAPHRSESGPSIHLLCADLAALPFRHAFDVIFSTATFHWVKDHQRLFDRLFQALKPGGLLEAQCGGGPNLARLRQRTGALMQQPAYSHFFVDWEDPWNYADPGTTGRRLRDAGFVDHETWLESAGFKLSTAEEYRQYLATVTLHRHVAHITDPALRERFLNELAQQAISDPDFELDYWRLNIHARRPV